MFIRNLNVESSKIKKLLLLHFISISEMRNLQLNGDPDGRFHLNMSLSENYGLIANYAGKPSQI